MLPVFYPPLIIPITSVPISIPIHITLTKFLSSHLLNEHCGKHVLYKISLQFPVACLLLVSAGSDKQLKFE